MNAKIKPSLDDEDDDAAMERRVAALADAKGIPSLEPVTIARRAAPTKSVKLEMPDYLFQALSLAAVQQGVTKKYLILASLKAAGYEIEACDLEEDGRRNRGK